MSDDYPASIFISYQHADKELAEALQDGLEEKGYFVWRDSAELRAGDSIVERVTEALDQIEFVAALVSSASVRSNWCNKELSLAMTGEIAAQGVTIIPLRVNETPMPASLKDKFYVDVSLESTQVAVEAVAASIERHLRPIRQIPPRRLRPTLATALGALDPSAPIRLIGIDRDGIGVPRNDGSSGSGLYAVPLLLSRAPGIAWRAAFDSRWNRGFFSSMHRPGIAHVSNDRLILNGTTVDEVAKHHLTTLKEAIAAANEDMAKAKRSADEESARQDKFRQKHESDVDATISNMSFDA